MTYKRPLPVSLREFADALDKDRGHGKSYVTLVMREAATEIERLRGYVGAIASGMPREQLLEIEREYTGDPVASSKDKL
jgi:hypothetical protein